MLGPGVDIVGIETVTILRGIEGGDVLMLRVVLSNGAIGSTHWHLDGMREFVSQVEAPRCLPTGAILQ